MSSKNTKNVNTKNVRTTYRCSFCGKSQDQVQRLIAGPGGVYICDECIDLCLEIIGQEQLGIGVKSFEEWVEEKIEKPSVIIRNVTLPQEYQPIGFSLISYFAQLIQYKYANTPINCHLEVNGRTIRLFIRTGEANKGMVEKLLDDYGLMLQGKLQPQQLLTSPEQVKEFEKLSNMIGLALRWFAADEKMESTLEAESIEEKEMRLRNALGWVFRRELEDVEDVFV